MKKDQSSRKWLLGVVAVLLILVIVVVVSGIQSSIGEDSSRLKISNWGEVLPQMPVESRARVEEVLYNRVNVGSVEGETSALVAQIRAGSQNSVDTDMGLTLGDFIVDIPGVQQSYIVQYFYGNGSGDTYEKLNNGQEFEMAASVTTYCVTNQEDIIYPDFVCVNDGLDSNLALSAFYMSFLSSQAGILVDDKEATLSMDYSASGLPRLNIIMNNCNGSQNVKQAEVAARAWVESVGLDPDMFIYRVPIKYDYCKIE